MRTSVSMASLVQSAAEYTARASTPVCDWRSTRDAPETVAANALPALVDQPVPLPVANVSWRGGGGVGVAGRSE